MSSDDSTKNIESLYVAICDLNGLHRAKRIPADDIIKAQNGEVRMPLSAVSVDIWGADIESDGGVFDTGDLDGICKPTGRAPLQTSDTSGTILPIWMFNDDGTPYSCDPRQALAKIVSRYKEKKLTPVVATELEFFLMDADSASPKAPISPLTGKRLIHNSVLSLDELEEFELFLNDIYKACELQNIPADAAISENGCGQFEVNLLHIDDPLKAADDAIFFKRIVKSAARKHGMIASFMAKPYGKESGSGLHVHFSLLDSDGNNIFDDGGELGTDILKYAVNGLITAMPESMLIFAPHYNSYRRLRPGSHAPTTAGWGYENRTASIRIPGGDPKARRIEHRVSGADANPYLVLAAILGSALVGIEEEKMPIPPVVGNAYEADLEQLPTDWSVAITAFEEGDVIPNVFSDNLRDLFSACKRQEMSVFATRVTDFEYDSYLERV